jgi:outer membrane protein
MSSIDSPARPKRRSQPGLAAAALIAALAATATLPAWAQDSRPSLPGLRGSYLHLGLGVGHQADDGALTVNGAPFPGAGYSTVLMYAPSVEIGAFVRPDLAISGSATGSLTTENTATGALAGMGNLGTETTAMYSLTGHYHLHLADNITPYVGGGIGYMQVLKTQDGVISNFNVDSAVGPVLQAGVDVAIDDHIGLYADLKRYFISTTAKGNLGPAQVTAQSRVDPWVLSTGVALKF